MSQTQWSMIWSPDEFRWEVGVTPFSNPVLPFGTMLVYPVVIYALQAFMTNRKALNLKWVSFVHNCNLCALSVFMLITTVMQVKQRADEDGVHAILCEPRDNYLDGRLGWIVYIFGLSKYYELVDTLLLALQKKTIIKLHVFHHATMLVICYLWHVDQYMVGGWYCTFINSFIHSIMYYYYAQTTLGNRVWWKKYLTTLQIAQFISGVCVIWYWAYASSYTHTCHVKPGWAFTTSNGLNLIFLTLFTHLFLYKYIAPAKDDKKKKDAKSNGKAE